MASKTNIANMAMVRIGEALFTNIDTDGTTAADEVNAIWDIVLEDTILTGPEQGYKFSTRTYHGLDREEFTIDSIAESGTTGDITVTGTHTLLAGDQATLDDTAYDGSYDVEAISTTASFDVTATFGATDTGTAYWTSEEYAYRFARPTSLKIISVTVGGQELTDWDVDGSYIMTNLESSAIDCKYIKAIADITVTNIPNDVIQVLWRKIAIHVLYTRSLNQALQDRLTEELETIYLPRAMGINQREQYNQEESSSWVDAGHTRTTLE